MKIKLNGKAAALVENYLEPAWKAAETKVWPVVHPLIIRFAKPRVLKAIRAKFDAYQEHIGDKLQLGGGAEAARVLNRLQGAAIAAVEAVPCLPATWRAETVKILQEEIDALEKAAINHDATAERVMFDAIYDKVQERIETQIDRRWR